MTKENIRIGLSWGLILVAIVHAVMLAALCIGARLGTPDEPQCGPHGCTPLNLPREPIGSIGMQEKFAEPPAVNYSAQHEMKQQCPPGEVCWNKSNPFNLAPGERLVPGSVRVAPQLPNATPIITPVQYPAAQAAGTQTPAKSYQVLLFVDNSAQGNTLRIWFEQDPELIKLRARSSFQVYTPDNSLYRTRFASIVPATQFPAVLVQDASGGHIHAAGKSMIPGSSTELVSDIKKGWELYKQAKQGTIQNTGALRQAGYSWDDQINPAMRLSSDNCGPDGCPPQTDDRWRPGSRVNLFDRVEKAKNPMEALFWGSAFDIATLAVFGCAALLLVFVIARRS